MPTDKSKHKPTRTKVSSGSVYMGPITNVSTYAILPAGLPTLVVPPMIQVADITEEGDVFSEELDVYYNPEKFGLEPVAEINYGSGNYGFDLRVVWRHVKTGTLYTARDGGCSCPSPFEDYTSLKKLDRFVLSEIEEEVLEERKDKDYEGDNPAPFLEAIRALVPKTYPQGPRRLLSVDG